MANTYTQLYVHYVFAVQNRLCLISNQWKQDLYKYINGIIAQQGHKCYCANGISDHVHVLVSMHPRQAPSDLMYYVKRSSSLWINENRLIDGKFSWQEGYGAFSCGKRDIHEIAGYIENQELHHKNQSFIKEYREFLEINEIDFDEKYLFKEI
jgi:REP element-mobilizing transposase RayT